MRMRAFGFGQARRDVAHPVEKRFLQIPGHFLHFDAASPRGASPQGSFGGERLDVSLPLADFVLGASERRPLHVLPYNAARAAGPGEGVKSHLCSPAAMAGGHGSQKAVPVAAVVKQVPRIAVSLASLSPRPYPFFGRGVDLGALLWRWCPLPWGQGALASMSSALRPLSAARRWGQFTLDPFMPSWIRSADVPFPRLRTPIVRLSFSISAQISPEEEVSPSETSHFVERAFFHVG